MVNEDFSIFASDPVLTSLRDLSVAKLHSALGRCIPEVMLDAPLASYRVTNLRYSPRQKLVVGLTSKRGRKPIALRIFPQESLQNRLDKARRSHPTSSFLLDELSAIAWVFPGERKLNLDPLNDQSGLSEILYARRGYRLTDVELVHFVPEHTYTARVRGKRDDGAEICEYLKIYYNDEGAVTAKVMQQLTAQLHNNNICIPDDVTYFPEQRMLLQSALLRDEAHTLSNVAAAAALACFHGMSASAAARHVDYADANHRATLSLIAETFPAYSDEVRRVSAAIRRALQSTTRSEDVLLHGDAHLGNLFPMPEGKVGVIDLDAVRMGPAEEDLASFFAFKLWLQLRDRRNIDDLLGEYPAFLQAYNVAARIPVSIQRAYQVLAQKMITERIRRGITRGKITDADELPGFVRIAVACLAAAERYCD